MDEKVKKELYGKGSICQFCEKDWTKCPVRLQVYQLANGVGITRMNFQVFECDLFKKGREIGS